MSVQAPAIDLWSGVRGGRTPARTPSSLVLGTLVYFALGLVGRATIAEGEILSLVWPAAGAAMLMFGLAAPRRWPLAARVVGGGGDREPEPADRGHRDGGRESSSVANVLQAAGAVLLLRALAPHLLGAGGRGAPRSAAGLLGGEPRCVVAALAGAAVGGARAGSAGRRWTLGTDAVVWWARNAIGPCPRR